MVALTKQYITHGPHCRCPICSTEQALPHGIEWATDEVIGKPARRHPLLYVVDLALLTAVAVFLAYVYLESVQ